MAGEEVVATIQELQKLGYTVTESMPATDEHPVVYSIESGGVFTYVSEDDLAVLSMPDQAVVAAEQAALPMPVSAKNPITAIAALDPKTATVADIIAAAKAGAL